MLRLRTLLAWAPALLALGVLFARLDTEPARVGEQRSAHDTQARLNMPFATFQLTFDSPNEFTGVDHVHRRTVHYRRVDAP